MKRAILLSLLVLSMISSSVYGQRPRRVGDVEPTAGSIPAKPPVLQGNTRDNRPTPNTPAPVADDGPEEVEAGDIIRVNTTLVTIPLSVMDRDGRYIPNLTKEDFRLWENGVEQEVAYFSSVDKPFSLVLMIDTSGSTRFRLEDIQDAAIAFVNQLRPDDRVMVVSFDDDVKVLSEFTSSRSQLSNAIRRTRPGGGTKLYEALDLVINRRLNQLSGRKAVVLFTDGVDTTSRRVSYHDNIRDAEELDALIYPIQYDTYADVGGGGTTWPGPAPTVADILGQILGGGIRRGGRIGRGGSRGPGTSRRDYELANQYLRELAERTGARQYNADTTQNLSYAFSNIAEELRRQYSLGFYPKRPAQAGERRQIRVRVNQPNLAVRARDSYVFNPSGTVQDTASKSAPVLRRNLSGSDRWPN